MTTEQRDTTEQQETAEQQETTELQEQAEHETKAREAERNEEAAGTSDDQDLFRDDELQGFRSRWDQVQGTFVDEPRESVQKADELVSDLVDRLTSGFAETRSGLEEQWNKGEDASTEDLRVELTRYRTFFNRLLKV
jgi:hypothetical protein